MSLTEELVLKRSKASSLEAVRTLNCWSCGLSDTSILTRMPNLEVLNIRCVWKGLVMHVGFNSLVLRLSLLRLCCSATHAVL